MKDINCVVGCRDSNGAPTLIPVRVTCGEIDYDNGNHYRAAARCVEGLAYEVDITAFVLDEDDPGWLMIDKRMLKDLPERLFSTTVQEEDRA